VKPNGDDLADPDDTNEKLEKINEIFEKFATRIEAKLDTITDSIVKHIDTISVKGDDKLIDETLSEEKILKMKEDMQKVVRIL
jgi:F0F1-type ATP synthase membrane subunit b/b'